MTQYDPRRASPETVLRVCESLSDSSPSEALTAARALEKECRVPLRPRSEVDADLARACRAAVDSGQLCGALFKQYVQELCGEQTYGPDNVASAGDPPLPCAVVGATFTPERLAKLRKRLTRDIEKCEPDCDSDECDYVLMRDVLDAFTAGSAAPKPVPESHACHPDDRPCNCDQALGLQREVDSLRRTLVEVLDSVVVLGGSSRRIRDLVPHITNRQGKAP